MTATDEIRALLDKRGVEWMGTIYTKPTQGHPTNTSLDDEYHDAVFIEYVDGSVLRLFDLTPEQAIEATLGRGTCKNVGRNGDFVCDECGIGIEGTGNFGKSIKFCPNCGRKVVSE